MERSYPLAALLLLLFAPRIVVRTHASHDLPPIAINDNRTAAGTTADGLTTLRLRAAMGIWRPEGGEGPALRVEAFGEQTGPLRIPAPLVRVLEGTDVIASVRNDLPHPLRVMGLCARDGTPCASIEVGPGTEREVRFTAGRPGTYHYWATTTGMPLAFRAAADTQLSGAFVVDSLATAHEDRVLVLTDWTSLTREQLHGLLDADDATAAFFALEPRIATLINGLSWPATERLRYSRGDDVRWRVVNLSSQSHPMHLHGFYFSVHSLGDGVRDTPFEVGRRPRVVTQLLTPGATMAMVWRPEREGNWLFHCHIMEHVSPDRRLTAAADHHQHHKDDGAAGMAGMVLGVTVMAQGEPDAGTDVAAQPVRRLTLTMAASGPLDHGDSKNEAIAPKYGFALREGSDPPPPIAAPGPPIVLRRGQPVEIALVNQLPEATAIHWHGMELDSYYDGVHGWGGTARRATPMVAPGSTFVVRFTPPRAGTFIYHTHLHDERQLTAGLYGAMIVTEPGETFDPARDHVVVIGRDGVGRTASAILNGSREPLWVWKAGTRHRIRLINITPSDIFVTSILKGDAPIDWRPLTKDGAPVPESERTPRPASQAISVGETFDFEIDVPSGRQTLWINVRTPGGRWMVQGRIVAK
jgi:manganese oxidase